MTNGIDLLIYYTLAFQLCKLAKKRNHVKSDVFIIIRLGLQVQKAVNTTESTFSNKSAEREIKMIIGRSTEKKIHSNGQQNGNIEKFAQKIQCSIGLIPLYAEKLNLNITFEKVLNNTIYNEAI